MNAQTTTTWQTDVFALCKENAQRSGELPIALLTRLASDLTDTQGALKYEVSGQIDHEKHSLLRVCATGTLMMRCQRCAEDIPYAVNVDNTLALVHSEEELDSEEEDLNAVFSDVDHIEKIVGSKEFDLLNLLEDEIILSLPIVIAHEQCEKTLPSSFGEKVSAFDVLKNLKNG